MKFIVTILILILALAIYANICLHKEIQRQKIESQRLIELVDRARNKRDIYYKQCQRYQLQDEAVGLRQLNFLRPVEYKTIDKDQLKGIIQKKAEEGLTGEDTEIDDYEKVLVKFGFMEPGDHLMPYITALYSEQVQGMYDEENGEMILVEGLPLTGSIQRMFMVHELTHALQDQHFDLSSLPLYEENEDRALAALSLIEGDASLVMFLYYKDHLKMKQLFWDLISYVSIDQSQVYTSPYFIRENLLFPYKWGVKFVTFLYAQGGWDRINQVFKNTPGSTEQILHPEKYGIDEPKEVAIKDEIPEGWRELDRNTMGEFNTRIFLSIYLGEYESLIPSEGWGGDKWAVWENQDTGELRAIWYTLWDTPEDADEFFNACRKLLRKRRLPKARIAKRKDYVKVEW